MSQTESQTESPPSSQTRPSKRPREVAPDHPEEPHAWRIVISRDVLTGLFKTVSVLSNDISFEVCAEKKRLYMPWRNTDSNVCYRASIQALDCHVEPQFEKSTSVSIHKSVIMDALKIPAKVATENLVLYRPLTATGEQDAHIIILATNGQDTHNSIRVPLLEHTVAAVNPHALSLRYTFNMHTSDLKTLTQHVCGSNNSKFITIAVEQGEATETYTPAALVISNEDTDPTRAVFSNRFQTALVKGDGEGLTSNAGVAKGVTINPKGFKEVFKGTYYVQELNQIAEKVNADVLSLSVIDCVNAQGDPDQGHLILEWKMGMSNSSEDITGLTLIIMGSTE